VGLSKGRLFQEGKVRLIPVNDVLRHQSPKPHRMMLAPRFCTAYAHLLNPCNGHLLLHAPCFALSGEVIVHLARAEEDPLDLVWAVSCRAGFRDHPLKVGSYKRISRPGWFSSQGLTPCCCVSRGSMRQAAPCAAQSTWFREAERPPLASL
jgi:hypothetical protein